MLDYKLLRMPVEDVSAAELADVHIGVAGHISVLNGVVAPRQIGVLKLAIQVVRIHKPTHVGHWGRYVDRVYVQPFGQTFDLIGSTLWYISDVWFGNV